MYYESEILYVNMPRHLDMKKDQIINLTKSLIDNEFKLLYLWENVD